MEKLSDEKIEELLDLGENILVSVLNGTIVVATEIPEKDRILEILAAAIANIEKQFGVEDDRGPVQ